MSDQQDVTPHAEIYISTQDGSDIKVRCFCRIGRDHDHAEWRREYPTISGPSRSASTTSP